VRRRILGAGLASALAIALGTDHAISQTTIATDTGTAASLRIVSPTAESYMSGPVTLKVALGPGVAEVERVTIFVDGRLACAIEKPPYECAWDAGPGVRERVVRAVATMASGSRVVANVRTRGVKYADAVEVRVVQVSVLVKDREGQFVSGLTAKDFRLLEDGVAQRITNVADEDAPLELVMALDISSSMAGVMPDVKAAATTFMGALRERDALAILGFNDNIFTVARREATPDARVKALSRLAPWGGTSLYDAISRALGLLQRQAGRKGIVVLSDGDDESSRLPRATVEQELQSSDAAMYTVGLGRAAQQDALREVLERLSDVTGGRLVAAREPKALEEAFTAVVNDLAHQYVLSYAPSNDARDGSWRRIEVEVPGRNYRLRARQGYRAPPPQPETRP
jgi:Ca-activated chloride channel homolog